MRPSRLRRQPRLRPRPRRPPSMAEITAAAVGKLREMTNAGLMDCKKALVEANGDLPAAVDILRKKGVAMAAKKAGREAKEGALEGVSAFLNKPYTAEKLLLTFQDVLYGIAKKQ